VKSPERRRPRLIPPLERDAKTFARSSGWLLAVVVLLPNVVPWVIGAVWVLPRPVLNLDYAVVALLHPWLGASGVGVLVGLFSLVDLAVAGAYHFHGNPAALIQAAPDALHLPLSLTLPYALVLGGATVGVGWIVRRLIRGVPKRSGPNLAAAAVAYLLSLVVTPLVPTSLRGERAVALGDFLDNAVLPAVAMATEYHGLIGGHVPAASTPLFQAFDQGDSLPPRVVLVVLESWGRLLDPTLDSLATMGLDTAGLDSLYRVERGEAPQYGSTVKGELRELCRGRSGSVRPDVALLPVAQCLPELFDARGYRTMAFHGFLPEFFDREDWWPGLGFDSVEFRDDIATALGTRRMCGGAFEGICDTDVARLLGRELSRPDTAGRPRRLFLYWLTLNAHPPYNRFPGDRKPVWCASGGPAKTDKVCSFMAWNDQALSAITKIAVDHADGRTAWILVGDHPTPFDSPRERALVEPDSVPFVRLWPRGWEIGSVGRRSGG